MFSGVSGTTDTRGGDTWGGGGRQQQTQEVESGRWVDLRSVGILYQLYT